MGQVNRKRYFVPEVVIVGVILLSGLVNVPIILINLTGIVAQGRVRGFDEVIAFVESDGLHCPIAESHCVPAVGIAVWLVEVRAQKIFLGFPCIEIIKVGARIIIIHAVRVASEIGESRAGRRGDEHTIRISVGFSAKSSECDGVRVIGADKVGVRVHGDSGLVGVAVYLDMGERVFVATRRQ